MATIVIVLHIFGDVQHLVSSLSTTAVVMRLATHLVHAANHSWTNPPCLIIPTLVFDLAFKNPTCPQQSVVRQPDRESAAHLH
jgi:hypothetical protein